MLMIGFIIAFGLGCRTISEREVVQKETQAYYALWIGVRAPEFNTDIKDRNDGGLLRIQDYHGKRLLLFSFDAGDFVRLPDEAALMAQLGVLKRAFNYSADDTAIIGFTYGTMFFLPYKQKRLDIKSLTEFPMVNNANIELKEPYNLLQRWPSAILIDRNGIIVEICPQTMTEKQLVEAVSKPEWEGKPHSLPVSDPPELVKNYSSRKPFVIYVYGRNLERGSQFQHDSGHLGNVYLKSDVPMDSVTSLKKEEGKTLRASVRKGDPIRKSDFED